MEKFYNMYHINKKRHNIIEDFVLNKKKKTYLLTKNDYNKFMKKVKNNS